MSRILIPLCSLLLLPCLPAQGVPTRRASADAAGLPGNADSFRPSLSADGRVVAFTSRATNLVPGDTNGVDDVFVHDRASGAIQRISIRSDGAQANGRSYDPVVTPDGRYVAFTSVATNLTPIDGGSADVFVHDRVLRTTRIASVSSLGIPGNDDSGSPSISGDGRRVAFSSQASNLVPLDGNGHADVFVHDLQSGTTTRVPTGIGGLEPNGGSMLPRISGDGRFVAFSSGASNLVPGDTNATIDAFVRDLTTGVTTRVSAGAGGAQANGISYVAAITGIGDEVAFWSYASNLVPGDTNGFADVFVASRDGARIARVNVGGAGEQADGFSSDAAMSRDGRFVAFTTRAKNLAAGDRNAIEDVYLRDRMLGTTRRATTSPGGGDPNGRCERPSISDDCRWIAFDSPAPNLIQGKTVAIGDVLRTDLRPAHPAAFAAFGAGCRGSAGIPVLGRDPHSLPWIGSSLVLTLGGAAANRPCWLTLGASNRAWGAVPLPLPLDAAGMPGCAMLASPDLSFALATDPNGGLRAPLPIPFALPLLGAALHAQVWIHDPAANAFGLVVTNGATLTIGG